ncbi:MAG TPA: DEAD/DEAH box helicase [Chloroflexota bacterium]|nr:DEAD/DEAH box helicase [Chloroflexota bacterium]
MSEDVIRAVEELGYEAPTPVQHATIRLLMDGRDLIAQAQTGTGKTAAYGIPMVERVDVTAKKVQCLVLTPTRELAIQVAEALHQLGKYRGGRGVRVLPVYGGQPIERQLRALREGVHVVVGTPGRLLDHLRRRTVNLKAVELAAIDEADEMLDLGFLEDVEAILAALARPAATLEGDEGGAEAETTAETEGAAEDVEDSESTEGAGARERPQLAMFSATIPAPVAALARRFLHEPARVAIEPEQVTVPQITQIAYDVGRMDKVDALGRILDAETPGSALVFCATRRMVDDVAERLSVRGYRAAALHGDMAQAERERVLRRFRNGQIEVLVATDVAARGLDIEGITHVINFDVPWDPESYVHRIGRTGRAGRAGDAITLVAPRDYRLLRPIEQLLRRRIERKRLPSLGDVAMRRREATKEAVAAAIGSGGLDGYLDLAGELGERFDLVEVAAASLRLWDEARRSGAAGPTLASALHAAATEATEAQSTPPPTPSLGEVDDLTQQAAAELEDGQPPETGMKRLFLAAGRADGLRPQDVVGAIANEAKLPGRSIGAIDIYDRFSFVEVPEAHADRVINALRRTSIRGQRVGVRLASPAPATARPKPRLRVPTRTRLRRRPADDTDRGRPRATRR